MKNSINFSGKAHLYTQEEIALVAKVMQEADPLTQGKYRNEFEEKFAKLHDVPFAFSVCNATAALEMSAQSCQFKDGDELIAPTHTFTASVYPYVKKGAKIVWADIDLETRVVTAETIEAKITNKTKAILVVHLYGYMADMPAIMDLAKKHNLLVIEDNAQALGTDINGQKSGSFADFGIFSFHSHKNITTLGEGGMLTVKDKKYSDIIPMLRHNGHCNYNFDRPDYWIPAMGNVDLPELDGKPLMPNNYCLGEVECALGTKLLDRIDTINNEKRKRAINFIDSLKDFPELEFHRVDSTRHNYHLLVARVTNSKRNEIIRKLFNEKNIKCVVQYIPLHRYDFYKKMGFGKADCPNSKLFFDTMISFPFQHWLTDDEISYMLESTKEVLLSLR